MVQRSHLWPYQHLIFFCGGENMHARYEYVSKQVMEKAADVILGDHQVGSN